ncbi:MAG TPA: hypothetical protein PK640_14460, partial [Verrucomicrobiota bacterium]|nr:hypothetical protein [Verrucomicrobiota bacterium]
MVLALALGLSRSAQPAERDDRFFDAAPFARVCTWDSQRDAGVRANRLEEIAADDLFLAKDLMPGLEGDCSVEPAANGEACIGLEWIEARPLTRLQIRLKMPPARPVRIQFWRGETVWQGQWASVDGAMDGEGLVWTFTPTKVGGLYWKVRWIVPAGSQPVAVTGFEAMTSSTVTASDLFVQSDPGRPGQMAEIEVYNGSIIGIEGTRRSWDMGAP